MSDDKPPTSPSAGSGAGSPPKAPAQQCTTCTVTLSPKDIKICGANKTKEVTATGTPGGGSFAFGSGDTAVATVTGNANKGTIKSKGQGKTAIKVTYNAPGCSPCTDTVDVKVCTCTPKGGGGRYYAYAGPKSIAKLIGGKAKIKTRYGKVCCENEGCSTENAYHVVYVNVSNNSGDLRWAQTGWGRERSGGSAAVKKYRYAEMKGDVYKVNYDTGNAPVDGTSHEYKCELDKATGKWTFSYDGTAWENYTDNFWKNKTGTDVQWTGEIFNKEDDMPGISGDKCSFTECQYQTEGKAFKNAGLVAGDINSDDSGEWGAEHISGTEFNIWDKKPII